MNRESKLKLNSVLSLVYQCILIASGLILPRFFLGYYGSEAYGLVSSITQFLSFINLCDLGLGAVVSSALFKPLAEKDNVTVSTIIATAKRFFRIISFILVVYVFALVLAYPKAVADHFDTSFTVGLILAMAISTFGQYFFGITYQLLLNADQNYYYQVYVNGITLILNTGACILLIMLGFPIQVVKLATSVIYLCRPIALWLYVKKNYRLDSKAHPDWSSIPQKANGIVQHISYILYENTDIIVLTLCSSLENVAVYSVYYLIVNCIKTILNSMTGSIVSTFGNMVAKQEDEALQKTFSVYDWFLHTVGALLFSITAILICQFVKIYTKGVEDAEYYVPVFAGLLTLAAFLNTVRGGMFNVIKAAGHYQQTQNASLVEALLNLSLSLIFVTQFGLVGVAIGTVAATLFYVIFEIVYLSGHILRYSWLRPVKLFLTDFAFAGIAFLSTRGLSISSSGYGEWFLSALIVSCICFAEWAVFQLVFYRKETKSFIHFCTSRKTDR